MRYEIKLITRLIIALLSLIFFKIYYLIFTTLTIYPIYFLLFLLKYSPLLEKNIILINNIPLKIIPACIAGSAYALFTLLLLLTKNITWKKMLKIWLLGVFLILAMNITRLTILIILFFNLNINYFETLHLFFWKFLSTIYVVLIWIFLTWLFKIKTIPLYSDIKYLIKIMKR